MPSVCVSVCIYVVIVMCVVMCKFLSCRNLKNRWVNFCKIADAATYFKKYIYLCEALKMYFPVFFFFVFVFCCC